MKRKTQNESTEFTRFRDLSKMLIAVPKREIDQQRAAYDRKKEKASKSKRPAK
jgi:hypothetical protein